MNAVLRIVAPALLGSTVAAQTPDRPSIDMTRLPVGHWTFATTLGARTVDHSFVVRDSALNGVPAVWYRYVSRRGLLGDSSVAEGWMDKTGGRTLLELYKGPDGAVAWMGGPEFVSDAIRAKGWRPYPIDAASVTSTQLPLVLATIPLADGARYRLRVRNNSVASAGPEDGEVVIHRATAADFSPAAAWKIDYQAGEKAETYYLADDRSFAGRATMMPGGVVIVTKRAP